MQPKDQALTAVTVDGAFRVIVLRTTQTTREAARRQEVTRRNAAHLADVLTGTVLVRLTMAPTYRVQGIVRGVGGRGTLVADSRPDGSTRGLLRRPGELEEIEVGEGSLMQMMRTLPRGDVNQGIIEVPAGGVSPALMNYFHDSEQITAVASVGTTLDVDGAIERSGGYIVQLLPEVSRDPLAAMTARLEGSFFREPAAFLPVLGDEPEVFLARILEGIPFAKTRESAVRFDCGCSMERVLASLSTLSSDEVEELARAEEALHITCDYCGEVYEVSPGSLTGLLEAS
jgi:molecular chaperone Hsp33